MTCRACSRTGQSHPSCQACATLYWRERAEGIERAFLRLVNDGLNPELTTLWHELERKHAD